MREHPPLAGVKVQHEIRDDEGGFVSRTDFDIPDIKYAVYCDVGNGIYERIAGNLIFGNEMR